jgi:hypothetical protein
MLLDVAPEDDWPSTPDFSTGALTSAAARQ